MPPQPVSWPPPGTTSDDFASARIVAVTLPSNSSTSTVYTPPGTMVAVRLTGSAPRGTTCSVVVAGSIAA
jgi:hypothetical protein